MGERIAEGVLMALWVTSPFWAVTVVKVTQARKNRRRTRARTVVYREDCKHYSKEFVRLNSNTPYDGTLVAWICKDCDKTEIEPRWMREGTNGTDFERMHPPLERSRPWEKPEYRGWDF